jgi:hypothetical protein
MSVSYGHVLPFFKTRNDILLDQEAVQWCGNMMYQLKQTSLFSAFCVKKLRESTVV